MCTIRFQAKREKKNNKHSKLKKKIIHQDYQVKRENDLMSPVGTKAIVTHIRQKYRKLKGGLK